MFIIFNTQEEYKINIISCYQLRKQEYNLFLYHLTTHKKERVIIK